MLKAINRKYLIFGTFFYAFVAFLFPVELKALYLVNYLSLIMLAVFVGQLERRPEEYFNRKKLGIVVFFYSLFMIFCYNVISYFYTGNLYVFSEDDAMLYHREASAMADMPFVKSIDYYLSRHESEDLGIVIILSALYKVVASKVLLSIFYVFIAVVTANCIYSISARFMSAKYAFLCALVYCTSSYMIWYHSSGLKESVLVLLITLFYSSYYRVDIDKKITSAWWLALVPCMLLLFRPVLAMFCLFSIGMGLLLKRKLSVPQVLLLIAGALAGIYFMEKIVSSTDKFLVGGTESMLEIKEISGMVKGSVSFTYFVNTLSSMFGPFPSPLSSKVHLMFYAPGLIFKVFISVAFWLGVIHCIHIRMSRIYPMLFFVIAEMASLTYILEALELRKSLPHFPLVYIIAFIFIYKFDHNQLLTLKNHMLYKKSFHVAAIVLCGLMVYWNFR